MVKFQHVHVSYSYRIIKVFTGSTVSEFQLSGLGVSTVNEQLTNIFLRCSIKNRCCYIPALSLCCKTEVNLKYLSYVHSGRYTQRIEHYLKAVTILHERHILFRQDSWNDTLVTVTTGHLISDIDFSLCCDINPYELIYPRIQFIAVFSCKSLYIDNYTGFTMWNL